MNRWLKSVRSSALASLGNRLMCLALLLGFGLISTRAASLVERTLTLPVRAGVPFAVTNRVSAGDEVLVYAVEETVPPGWSVGKISFSGFIDLAHGKIKWGPFFDRESRSLTYELIAPAETTGSVALVGIASFNGDTVAIQGITQLRVEASGAAGAVNQVISQLPELFVPGERFSVTNRVLLSENTIAYSVEENIPAGWTTGSINQSGRYDALTGKVKWGPFLDRVERDLVVELTPPLGTTNRVVFSGVGVFDGNSIPLSGSLITSPLLSTITAQMPARFADGELITLGLVVNPSASTRVYAVEDRIPAGWEVKSVSHGGTFDAQTRLVKWGPYFSADPVVLTCEVESPRVPVSSEAVFVGVGSFDGLNLTIAGQRRMSRITSEVIRSLPPEALMNGTFSVTNSVRPDPTVKVYAIEDELPIGAQADAISHGGVLDPITRRIKWGPFLDRDPRELSFTIRLGTEVSGILRFRGIGSFDGVQSAIGGQQETVVVVVSSLNTARRSLVGSVRASRSVVVTNEITIQAPVLVQAIEDELPEGWNCEEISHDGVFDAKSQKVKWGPFFDSNPRSLTYRLLAPGNAGGRVTLKGTLSYDSYTVPIGGSSNLLVIANHLPVAREDTFEALDPEPMIFPIGTVLANDNDPDGDPLAVLAVSSASSAGGTVRLSDGVITYTPPAAVGTVDTFEYTISDGFGGTAKGIVRVTRVSVRPGLNRWRVETFPDGTIRLRFAGIPGRTYRILATDSLKNAVWIELDARVAGAQGDFEFHDTDALSHPTRFYRSVSP